MKLQASTISRVLKCPGSYYLEQSLPAEWQYNPWQDKANYGTAVHAVGETALRSVKKMTVKQIEKEVAKAGITGDEAVKAVHTVKTYDEYVRALVKKIKGRLIIEDKCRVNISGCEFVAKADALIIAGNDIHVIDLKTGSFDYTDSVKAQLLFGGLVKIADIGKDGELYSVIGHVVQPAYYNAPEQAKSVGLLFCSPYCDSKSYLSYYAEDTRDNPDQFTPGDHCSFCRALPKCPKQTALALAYSGDNMPTIEMSIEKLDFIVSHKKEIEKFLDACESQAKTLIESGAQFPSIGFVQSKGRRRWKDAALAEMQLKEKFGDAIYEPAELKSPAAMEKIAGKKNIEDLVESPTIMKVGKVENPFKAVE